MKLFSIQYYVLAAIAIVLVLAAKTLHYAMISLDARGYSVDLLFVISGFIMFYTTASESQSAVDFHIKRIVRIFPIYSC